MSELPQVGQLFNHKEGEVIVIAVKKLGRGYRVEWESKSGRVFGRDRLKDWQKAVSP